MATTAPPAYDDGSSTESEYYFDPADEAQEEAAYAWAHALDPHETQQPPPTPQIDETPAIKLEFPASSQLQQGLKDIQVPQGSEWSHGAVGDDAVQRALAMASRFEQEMRQPQREEASTDDTINNNEHSRSPVEKSEENEKKTLRALKRSGEVKVQSKVVSLKSVKATTPRVATTKPLAVGLRRPPSIMTGAPIELERELSVPRSSSRKAGSLVSGEKASPNGAKTKVQEEKRVMSKQDMERRKSPSVGRAEQKRSLSGRTERSTLQEKTNPNHRFGRSRSPERRSKKRSRSPSHRRRTDRSRSPSRHYSRTSRSRSPPARRVERRQGRSKSRSRSPYHSKTTSYSRVDTTERNMPARVSDRSRSPVRSVRILPERHRYRSKSRGRESERRFEFEYDYAQDSSHTRAPSTRTPHQPSHGSINARHSVQRNIPVRSQLHTEHERQRSKSRGRESERHYERDYVYYDKEVRGSHARATNKHASPSPNRGFTDFRHTVQRSISESSQHYSGNKESERHKSDQRSASEWNRHKIDDAADGKRYGATAAATASSAATKRRARKIKSSGGNMLANFTIPRKATSSVNPHPSNVLKKAPPSPAPSIAAAPRSDSSPAFVYQHFNPFERKVFKLKLQEADVDEKAASGTLNESERVLYERRRYKAGLRRAQLEAQDLERFEKVYRSTVITSADLKKYQNNRDFAWRVVCFKQRQASLQQQKDLFVSPEAKAEMWRALDADREKLLAENSFMFHKVMMEGDNPHRQHVSARHPAKFGRETNANGGQQLFKRPRVTASASVQRRAPSISTSTSRVVVGAALHPRRSRSVNSRRTASPSRGP